MSDASPDLLSQLLGSSLPSTPEEMRELLERFGGLLNQGLPEVGAFHEAVPVCDGVVTDVVVPRGDGPHPVLVYFHGGGWICGSPTTHRKLGHRFAEAGFLVLNVDYRLAPEYPFPTPFEDCMSALRWAHAECARWGGDPERFFVGGDSAGANLSAAAAVALAGDPACPKAALLIYGVFDFAALGGLPTSELDSNLAVSGNDGEKLIELMMGSYLGSDRSDELLCDPRVSPLHAAEKLPPSHVVVGSADVLASQSESLVKQLEKAGITHEHFVDAEMPHGYVQMEFLPPARPAIERMVEFLRRTP
ncbi:MAG: alpha/beta hydrolase [Myxococcota bacterium]|nr:alpha/beta hydrolase [bacterium]MDP6075159.1 alpha/beta hydrolase [Myxococcota bacterium]MDP6242147.1 alpha/beta hydrolase [Myxococcota bacterium]MDP7074732.1 alpha/beta hydrolase [Myxococcota bacterium]MDP7298947.1 alpha/beta hydrolase [Myxococcota bacterium]